MNALSVNMSYFGDAIILEILGFSIKIPIFNVVHFGIFVNYIVNMPK